MGSEREENNPEENYEKWRNGEGVGGTGINGEMEVIEGRTRKGARKKLIVSGEMIKRLP